MKNLTIVSVLLSVFTVTSHTALAQPQSDFNNITTTSYTNYYTPKYTNKTAGHYNEANAVKLTLEECTVLQFKYAQLLDIEVEEIADSYLFNFIEEWWAVRYRYGGTTKRGVDCSSYTGQLLYSVYGVTMPRTARAQYGVTNRVNRMDLQQGDLVFFNTRGGVSHVGVYLGNDRFTHSSSSSGVTISSLNEPYYSRKYIGGGRINKKLLENYVEEDEPLAE